MSLMGEPITGVFEGPDGNKYWLQWHYAPGVFCAVGLAREVAGKAEADWVSMDLHWKPWRAAGGTLLTTEDSARNDKGHRIPETVEEITQMIVGAINDFMLGLSLKSNQAEESTDVLEQLRAALERYDWVDGQLEA